MHYRHYPHYSHYCHIGNYNQCILFFIQLIWIYTLWLLFIILYYSFKFNILMVSAASRNLVSLSRFTWASMSAQIHPNLPTITPIYPQIIPIRPKYNQFNPSQSTGSWKQIQPFSQFNKFNPFNHLNQSNPTIQSNPFREGFKKKSPNFGRTVRTLYYT